MKYPENALRTVLDGDAAAAPLPANGSAQTLLAAMVQHPFLKGMQPRHLQRLVDCAMPTIFGPGQVIFREGEPADRFYLIQQGRVVLDSYVKNAGPVFTEIIGA